VLLDRIPGVAGLDTLYVADDRSIASGGGIQKWTSNGSTWTLGSTFNVGITTGVRGLAGYLSGANVVLIATTTETTNKIVAYVDDGSPLPVGSVLVTAGANTAFRGVAMSPN
jgi:hypothetical protein